MSNLTTRSHTFLDEVDNVYGKLTVIAFAGYNGDRRKRAYWLCKCSCGNQKVVVGNSLRRGLSTSCGKGKCRAKHGHCLKYNKSPHWRAWNCMIQRCGNPKHPRYKDYGGRGVEVRYEDVEAFADDIGPSPGPTYTVDRIDNNGHYEPGNCRWATPHRQARNRRNNRMLTFGGVTMCLRDWSQRLGIPYSTLSYRSRQGWPIERVFERG